MNKYIFALLFIGLNAQADWPLDLKTADYRLQVNGLSRHYVDSSRRDKLNETNEGLGIEARFDDGYFGMVGWMEDSYFATAPYIGYGKRWDLIGNSNAYIKPGIFGILTYRKVRLEDTDRELVPMLLPVLSLGTEKIPGKPELNLVVIPKIGDLIADTPTAFLQLTLDFPD